MVRKDKKIKSIKFTDKTIIDLLKQDIEKNSSEGELKHISAYKVPDILNINRRDISNTHQLISENVIKPKLLYENIMNIKNKYSVFFGIELDGVMVRHIDIKTINKIKE